ncbi:MAG: NAD-dependent epimerase/dehydratase family protein [Spirochaetales bacterium]|nr:NAD-dependent epimerase/dehydratase family protein [Spirochaetales bacterium]
MRSIVVTGGLGFLGQYVTEALRRAYPGTRVKIAARGHRPFIVPGIEGDGRVEIEYGTELSDADGLARRFEGADAVVHAAAEVSFLTRDRERLLEANATGTRNVVDACARSGVRRLLHVSSTAALGYSDDPERPADETLRYDWRKARGFAYMLSKRLAETEALGALAHGLDVVVANPSSIYGPGDPRAWPLFEAVAGGKLPALMPCGFAVVDVRDAASGIALVLGKGVRGERYLLTGGNHTYTGLMASIARAVGTEAPRRTLPRWLGPPLSAAAGLAERLASGTPRLSRELVAPGFRWRYFSSAKAERELGWRPVRDIDETMRDSIAYWRAAGGTAGDIFGGAKS